ncbi:MAG TPA: ABC transporter transmembrane domain-containing protein, partial [Azospira sp.]|nr:ABC transporter transmembrane domain-containing protein [Azospira sp.]
MRRSSSSDLPRPPGEVHAWPTIRALFPYLWQYKWRVAAALASLVGAKLASVAVPLVFKDMIDSLSVKDVALALPVLLLLLYGSLRLATSLFTELREMLFARVTQRAVRHIALEVFRHLHSLSLRFHLDRQTGGVSRDIERGSRSISSLISYTLYSILPTLVELGLVLGILLVRYDWVFAAITASSLVAYILFTVQVSNWRIGIRRAVNESDSAANGRAIDSLLNYETVKYFNNEAYEARRYDTQMQQWEDAATRSQVTLSFLNLGQQAIIASGV